LVSTWFHGRFGLSPWFIAWLNRVLEFDAEETDLVLKIGLPETETVSSFFSFDRNLSDL